MIAIHNNLREHLFHFRWKAYCDEFDIPYKLVDCYDSNIVEDLKGCKALFFHFNQASSRDNVMAKALIFSLDQAGIPVFPDFRTAWHFDDKVGQKYLLEALDAPLVPTWVFYDKNSANQWIGKTVFPKVFKLRGGAGSQNVKLVQSAAEAKKLVKQAFSSGFAAYDSVGSLKERFRKWRKGKAPASEVGKGLVRLFQPPRYAQVMGNEIDYVYFQEFIPGNDSDIRIVVVGDKAFAIKRMNREEDFRASGSGTIIYDENQIPLTCVAASFEVQKKLQAQCIAYDYVMDKNQSPLLVEISFGFANQGYDACTGYWDQGLNWYPGKFNPYGWMVDMMDQEGKKA